MRLKIRISFLLLGLCVFLLNCNRSNKEEPLQGDAVNGEKIFATNCAGCHQKDGKGKSGFAPSLNNIDFLQVANDQQIKRFVLEGRPGTSMIAFKDNPEVANNINDLVVYMRSWKKNFELYKEADIDKSWTSKGDKVKGEVLFKTYCVACHGNNGEGYVAGGSGTAIRNPKFLRITPDAYLKQVILEGRAGTAMKSFYKGKGLANLDENNIDDIVAFLRTNSAYEEPSKDKVVPRSEDSSNGGGTTANGQSAENGMSLTYIFAFAVLGFLICVVSIVLVMLIRMRNTYFKI